MKYTTQWGVNVIIQKEKELIGYSGVDREKERSSGGGGKEKGKGEGEHNPKRRGEGELEEEALNVIFTDIVVGSVVKERGEKGEERRGRRRCECHIYGYCCRGR